MAIVQSDVECRARGACDGYEPCLIDIGREQALTAEADIGRGNEAVAEHTGASGERRMGMLRERTLSLPGNGRPAGR